jgi:hypothetical protein
MMHAGNHRFYLLFLRHFQNHSGGREATLSLGDKKES